MCGPYVWIRTPCSSSASCALPATWGRRSITSTRRPKSSARRRAQTEPAKPAPTTIASKAVESARECMPVHRDVRVLAQKPLAVGRDLDADPGVQFGVLASDAFRQTVADPGVLDVDRRTARLPQAVEQIGVLVPQDERWVEELAGRMGE